METVVPGEPWAGVSPVTVGAPTGPGGAWGAVVTGGEVEGVLELGPVVAVDGWVAGGDVDGGDVVGLTAGWFAVEGGWVACEVDPWLAGAPETTTTTISASRQATTTAAVAMTAIRRGWCEGGEGRDGRRGGKPNRGADLDASPSGHGSSPDGRDWPSRRARDRPAAAAIASRAPWGVRV